jgi:hypothetical protein
MAAASATATQFKNGSNNYTEAMAVDISQGYEKLPHSLSKFIEEVGPVVNASIPKFPNKFEPVHITQYSYPLDGKLDGHIDNIR